MGKYINMDKQVLHSEGLQLTFIADAADTEKAHFLATMANAPKAEDGGPVAAFDYAAEAALTLSPAFHGELVSEQAFLSRLGFAIDALRRLDEVKKSLFYGRDNKIAPELGRMGTSHIPHFIAKNSPEANAPFGPLTLRQATDYIHGVLGLATEAGELLEGLRAALGIHGDGVDAVNVKEESGDAKWYLAILANTFGYGWRDDEHVNIAKLRKRFPDKFTEYDANNRDIAGERAVLEDGWNGAAEYEYLDKVRAGEIPRDVAEQALPLHHRTRPMEGERRQDGAAIEAQKPRSGPCADVEGMDA